MGNVQEKGKAQKKSKLNFVDEDSGTKGRAPPGSQADAEKKPKPRKLKSDAQKAKERAEQLRFGKAEITVDEASRMTKEQKREMYASAALLTAVHRKIEEYEDDNVGIKSAHEAEKGAELAGRVSDSRYAKKLKKRKKKLESKAAKQKAAAGKQPAPTPSPRPNSARYTSSRREPQRRLPGQEQLLPVKRPLLLENPRFSPA